MSPAKTSQRKKKANQRRRQRRIKGRYEKRHERERRPRVERERQAPNTVTGRARLVRGLTRRIQRIKAHLTKKLNWWRDRRRLYALERAINTRGEALQQIQADAPEVWAALIAELHLDLPMTSL